MHKLTKIVATVGPATESSEKILELIKAGVDVFRLNFKHNSPDWHSQMINKIRKVQKQINQEVGVLLDLQGEEIRMNLLADFYEIKQGDILEFVDDPRTVEGKEGKFFYFSHPEVKDFVHKGDLVIIDDGRFKFNVDFKSGSLVLVSCSDGVLSDRKTVSLPDSDFSFGRILERDLEGITIAVNQKVDFLAVSFVKTAEDIKRIMSEISAIGSSNGFCLPIAKLETKQAIKNLPSILDCSFGVMVARGDLAVETSLEEMPYLQKKIIRSAILETKPVITATQMLESMTANSFPTRAEISDVANAVYDYTDAVMLSNETAIGKYPVETVEIMSRILKYNEKKNKGDIRKVYDFQLSDQEEIVVNSAYDMYLSLREKKFNVKGFLVFTHTGRTARLLSRYRSNIPIFAFSPFLSVVRGLILSYGVFPFEYHPLAEKRPISVNDINKAVDILKSYQLVSKGDKLICLHGDVLAVQGGTNTVRLVSV
ncbi:MAG: pyruvate kinase [Patescibacteria group bacterium]|nr:MAG: pyruvate kinase [Patescibacteria group bacterium]